MKPLEILSALPQWAKTSPDAIVDSPAFAMTCRLGDESVTLRHAVVTPAESGMLPLSVAFGDEPHALWLARSPRFPELDKIWDSRADIPEPVLLALVERECGPFFQMLENAVRKQMRLVGLASAGSPEDRGAKYLSLQTSNPPEIVFSLTRSETVASALGALRNLDLTHEAIRSQQLAALVEYASFAIPDADIASLGPGDAVLLPEIGTVPPRLVVDGRFVADANGVAQCDKDALVHVRAAAGVEISLGELFDAVEKPPAFEPAAQGAQLKLVQDGRLVASGRLDRLADQVAFIVET